MAEQVVYVYTYGGRKMHLALQSDMEIDHGGWDVCVATLCGTGPAWAAGPSFLRSSQILTVADLQVLPSSPKEALKP